MMTCCFAFLKKRNMAKARALYDNYSDTSDELSFLRDDILEIIEKDYDGMEGWWLCGLKGKTGIAPANRLMIITINEATSDYDLPPIKNSSFSADKKPHLPNPDTTTMQDYDTPVSNRLTKSPLQNSRLKNLEKAPRANLSPGDAKEYDDYCVPSNKDDRSSVGGDSLKSPTPNITSTNFEKYYVSYLKSEKDMNVFSRQVTSMMKKWYDSSDHDSRAQIVKVICVSFWKAIQAYIAEAAKTIASIKGLVSAEMFKSFEEVKRSSHSLENVLDYLNRFCALDAKDKTKIEFLQQLSALTSSLSTHSQQLSEFFLHVEKESLWLRVGEIASADPVDGRRHLKAKGKNSESTPLFCKSLRSSYGDYDTPSTKFITAQDKLLNSPANLNVLVRDKGKKSETSDLGTHSSSLYSDPDQSFEATDYDVPRSSDISDYHSEDMLNQSDYSRPTSSEFLDYDCPKPKNPNNNLKNKSVESLSSELSRSSVIDDQVDYDIPTSNFSTFQLRASEMRFRNRPGMTKSADTFSKPSIFLSFEELDYDVPSNKGEVPSIKIDSPEIYLSRMVQSERNLLKYYYPFVAEELKNLSGLILRLQNHLTSSRNKAESKKPLMLINDVKGLAACSHKILFVVDSILKRIQSDPDLTSQLNFSCTKICEHLKNITNIVKQVSQVPSSPAEKLLPTAISNFQLHIHTIEKMVQHWK